MKYLFLWDIDGTLIDSGGAGVRALRLGLQNSFGISDLLNDIEYAGRTDRWIMRQIFAKFGLAVTEENFAAFASAYIAALPGEMKPSSAIVLPGIRALLGAAAAGGIAQGLLTGNLRRGAQVKLSFHGLWDYFPFGAFADDSEHRNELGPHALRRARERHGVQFLPENIWIIGDTPHDVDCARAIGANSLAVATGRHSAAELAEHQPTALLGDLSDASLFWDAIHS